MRRRVKPNNDPIRAFDGDPQSLFLDPDSSESNMQTYESNEDLIIPITFTVSKATHLTERLQGYDGIHLTTTGYAPLTRLAVETAAEVPTTELVYPGYSSLEKGDMITAYLHKYDEVQGPSTGMIVMGGMLHQTLYQERDLQASEVVSKIEKYGRDGRGIVSVFETDARSHFV